MNISVTAYDTLISESPNASIIASGDFNPINNEFKERVIINHCQLKQVVNIFVTSGDICGC